MFIEQPPHFVRLLWPGIWRIPQKEKCIYLTFDDGPNTSVTPFVLEILARYSIKATFFCVGDNAKKHPDVLARIRAEGHDVGNHTMHHLRGFEHTCEEYLSDVKEAQGYVNATLFRPPYGRITFKQLRELKRIYRVVMWDVITCDYNKKLKPQQIIDIVKKYTRNGSIIVFHDSLKAQNNVLNALEPSIQWLLKQGYSLKLLSDVI